MELTSRMFVRLDVPESVVDRRVLVAGDLLLLETPLGKLDLVGEEVASCEVVSKSEVGSKRTKSLSRLSILSVGKLDGEDVVADERSKQGKELSAC